MVDGGVSGIQHSPSLRIAAPFTVYLKRVFTLQ
jgi:hypothetical protein